MSYEVEKLEAELQGIDSRLSTMRSPVNSGVSLMILMFLCFLGSVALAFSSDAFQRAWFVGSAILFMGTALWVVIRLPRFERNYQGRRRELEKVREDCHRRVVVARAGQMDRR